MELRHSNLNKTSLDNSIINSTTLQQHLLILSASVNDLETQALELFESNPAIDHFEKSNTFSSGQPLDFLKQPNKENPFEQIPTKLLSTNDKILAEKIFQSVCKEGFLQQEEKSYLVSHWGPRVNFVLEIIQEHTGIGYENRVLFWKSILQKKKTDEKVVTFLDSFTDELLKADFKTIMKKLKISSDDLKTQYLECLKKLPVSPLVHRESNYINYKIDAEIVIVNTSQEISVHSPIPSYSLNPLTSLDDKDVKQFYKPHLEKLNVFLNGVKKRTETFSKVLEKLSKIQAPYLCGDTCTPLAVDPSLLAEELNIHPSTLARCLQNKAILTPRGVITLKSLATPSPLDTNKKELLYRLLNIVKQENKKKPYSDETLLNILKEKGLNISRRTIVKYRKELNIPDAKTRAFLA